MQTSIRHNFTSRFRSPARPESSRRESVEELYELRYGRRYLRDVPYPLPCDLAEIQRQNLRTLISCTIFGRPVCSPKVVDNPPRKVLEVGCGSGYWSSMCHEFFRSRGHANISFTGLDIAPLAPNLRQLGVNWTFVRHDLRRTPLPFRDGDFDLIVLKDLSLTLPIGSYQKLFDDIMRLLKHGGTLEIWESDHVLRSLLPHAAPAPVKKAEPKDDAKVARKTATYTITPSTCFAPVQNSYLRQANDWISKALDQRNLPPLPCSRIAPLLLQEPEHLGHIGMRRVAIPLGHRKDRKPSSPLSDTGYSNIHAKPRRKTLNADQIALRQTALTTVLQMIESLEPLLKEVSGKNADEWSHWWAAMMANLLGPDARDLNGECLEVGAWWATRLN
ncbi:S-adenosyl-L-methionine-dependent methyltransferase [Piedraia hortae CBS 480.64]|uniref:S-adenosyl-L-methionine-dependent methyltransferase n=1 Tax=Piedraia hortae CBS 480.64 TaxID=1314780 RepID=A0A6A7CAG6_9PEZI|nr:S-adenosyl-L-methionine-dependent methyltransferase [Piedraia hortae CBS 480.64]